MKKCSYCGRESEEACFHCGECITELPAAETPPPLPPGLETTPSAAGAATTFTFQDAANR